MKTICFECGNPATENHHVVPRSMEGTKTIPLCAKCHAKVHHLDENKRPTNLSELTKMGIDKKSRALEIWLVFYTIETTDYDLSKQEISDIIFREYDLKISVHSIGKILGRLTDANKSHIDKLFTSVIGEDLKYMWDPEAARERQSKTHEFYKLIQSYNLTDEEEEIIMKNSLSFVEEITLENITYDKVKSFILKKKD